jgi:hypothetical protein
MTLTAVARCQHLLGLVRSTASIGVEAIAHLETRAARLCNHTHTGGWGSKRRACHAAVPAAVLGVGRRPHERCAGSPGCVQGCTVPQTCSLPASGTPLQCVCRTRTRSYAMLCVIRSYSAGQATHRPLVWAVQAWHGALSYHAPQPAVPAAAFCLLLAATCNAETHGAQVGEVSTEVAAMVCQLQCAGLQDTGCGLRCRMGAPRHQATVEPCAANRAWLLCRRQCLTRMQSPSDACHAAHLGLALRRVQHAGSVVGVHSMHQQEQQWRQHAGHGGRLARLLPQRHGDGWWATSAHSARVRWAPPRCGGRTHNTAAGQPSWACAVQWCVHSRGRAVLGAHLGHGVGVCSSGWRAPLGGWPQESRCVLRLPASFVGRHVTELYWLMSRGNNPTCGGGQIPHSHPHASDVRTNCALGQQQTGSSTHNVHNVHLR